MLRHKVVDDRMVTVISYMANVGKDWNFISFVPITGNYTNWGVDINGVNYAAMQWREMVWTWGDDKRDTEENAKTRPFILLFQGSDNISYYKRFKTMKALTKYVDNMKDIDSTDEGLLFYNS